MTDALAHVPAIIAAHLAQLDRPGVLSIRPGYRFRKGWPVDKRPAIVVTVRSKNDDPAEGLLPSEIDGVPVDVRQASARKRRALDVGDAWPAIEAAPDSGTPPQLAGEVRPDGSAVSPVVTSLAAATPPKPQLAYSPPAGTSLQPITADVSVTACASPDAGWPVLKSFLGSVEQSLTIGLYDWTSQHVLDWFTEQLQGKAVRLVLDHPAKNPTADQTDEQTATALKTSLGDELTQAWALERADPLAAAWIFPSAYHIKVAVADGQRVWLSSGNWNNSNQPDIDPVNNPADCAEARSRDRDWHVVIDSPALAAVFEAYLANDLIIAEAHQATPTAAAQALTAAEVFAPMAVVANAQTPVFSQFFAPSTVSESMTITPVLTPDEGGYAAPVAALIQSAQHRLYMQFQYIELPKAGATVSPNFTGLIAAVVGRQQAGVDVRIVMSEFETQGYLEQLMSAGVDVSRVVRIQENVHNKGIVVDGSIVLVSSQNWSNAGTTQNRDAGVILQSAAVANYFEQIFLHDWEKLAKTQADED